jgi:transmembrane sensor
MTAQTLRLDDGSFVRLAPGSRLEARLREDQRTVELEGRAFFAVAPDGRRPFEVRTAKGLVRVLGTRFEVASGEDGLRTVVVEGRVELANAVGRVEVPGGSVGTALEGEGPQAAPVVDVYSFLDWPGGLLVFHSTPLRGVAREVQRHFGIPVRIDTPAGEGLRISASFEEGESFQEVLETLCSITGSECRIYVDSAVIGPRIGEGR